MFHAAHHTPQPPLPQHPPRETVLRELGRGVMLRAMQNDGSGGASGTEREKINTGEQRTYWNSLSPEYSRSIRISIDDFHYGPQIPGESELGLLPPSPPRPGATALELGCGGGQNSIWLARRGWKCTALDVSPAQLERATALAKRAGAEVEFGISSIEDFPETTGGRQFDLVHSSHAMEFLEHPGPSVRAMAEATVPGGLVMISTVHPIYNGMWIDGEFEDEDGGDAGSAGSGLFLTNYFRPPDDVRDDANGHAVSRAWPVSAWFDWFRRAGLTVERLLEPAATRDAPYTSDDWAAHGGQLDRIPSTIILLGRKTTGA